MSTRRVSEQNTSQDDACSYIHPRHAHKQTNTDTHTDTRTHRHTHTHAHTHTHTHTRDYETRQRDNETAIAGDGPNELEQSSPPGGPLCASTCNGIHHQNTCPLERLSTKTKNKTARNKCNSVTPQDKQNEQARAGLGTALLHPPPQLRATHARLRYKKTK